jgi:hypothetical protein
MTEYRWRHEEIAALLSRVSIKTCDGFSEKDPSWICPGCGRSKPQIVAEGSNVDVVACIYRHHDHIKNLIARLLDRELPKPLSRHEILARRLLKAELMRRFCRFKTVDVCHACNNVDTAAKKIVGAPWWFSFSPRGIRNVIRPPDPYASRHEIDRDRLRVVWDQVLSEIDGLEDRVTQAVREDWPKYATGRLF